MPQTEEEHLTGLEEENESVDGEMKFNQTHRNTDPETEVTQTFLQINLIFQKNKRFKLYKRIVLRVF